MKTFNVLFLIGLFVATSLFAKAETHFESAVKNGTELKNMISEKFASDLKQSGNYLYENNIRKIDNDVKVTFLINHKGEIRVLKVDCEDCDAAEYAKHVLHLAKVNVSEDMIGKKYCVNIKMKFKSV
jgi:fructose-bisphosphate aldolase class 1